jgi:DNA-directed RNA polymerase specialized sigma24 family protein
MKPNFYNEFVSIDSLRARSELIKKSALEFFDDLHKDEQRCTRINGDHIEFARNNKEELPEHEKVIIHLHYWENMTISEISTFLNIPYKLVEMMKNEAIHRLRLNYLIEFSQKKSLTSKNKKEFELVS